MTHRPNAATSRRDADVPLPAGLGLGDAPAVTDAAGVTDSAAVTGAEEAPLTAKGRWLLVSAAEVLAALEAPPTAASLNEAYADAAFFKCAAPLLGAQDLCVSMNNLSASTATWPATCRVTRRVARLRLRG